MRKSVNKPVVGKLYRASTGGSFLYTDPLERSDQTVIAFGVTGRPKYEGVIVRDGDLVLYLGSQFGCIHVIHNNLVGWVWCWLHEIEEVTDE